MGFCVVFVCILMVSFLTATTAQDEQSSVSSSSSTSGHGNLMAEMMKQQISLYAKVNNLEKSMATNKKELKTTKKKLAATKKDLATTKTDLAATKTNLTATETDLASTKTDLASTKTDLAATKTKLAATETDLASTKTDLASTKTSLASTKTKLAATETDLASTKTDLATTKTDLAMTKTKLAATETDLASTKTALKAAETKLDTGLNSLKPGSSFIRWGRQSCPNNTSLVYVGVAGGKPHNQKGSGTNPLCLTRTPEFDNTAKPSYYGLVYGAEYEHIHGHHNHDVPCSVCLAPQSTTVMVPATKTCPPGWTPQYSGHLATQRNDLYATEYVCLDGSPEDASNSSVQNDDGLVFHYTLPRCGSLLCPPYENDKIVTCVVCSK